MKGLWKNLKCKVYSSKEVFRAERHRDYATRARRARSEQTLENLGTLELQLNGDALDAGGRRTNGESVIRNYWLWTLQSILGLSVKDNTIPSGATRWGSLALVRRDEASYPSVRYDAAKYTERKFPLCFARGKSCQTSLSQANDALKCSCRLQFGAQTVSRGLLKIRFNLERSK